jgi:DNA-directed RNA polymerase specialized sigma24 family protein
MKESMGKPDHEFDPELLLSNLGWIRQVAQRLVGSAVEADDLVQQVCTRALE